MGELRYSVDGAPGQSLVLSSDAEEYQARISLAQGLKDGEHQLSMSVEEGPVAVDGLLVRRDRRSVVTCLRPMALVALLFCVWLLAKTALRK